ncbi:hypothetical protein DEO72_LG11g668 [Vigna unguiculata]|uniref:Secreted protein n=1 Tax=Vigna unguiculata TaxID=3917 RepID=A0A4D6NII8_VIGUN|nr:hypothetical protein DEO72_LG11g668 [Vigna unguiculata]
MECLVMLFGFVCRADAGRTVARSDTFTQASLSRLGENSRNRPRFLLELSLKRRALVLSEVLSRSGEKSWEPDACHYSCSPGEEPHLWARGGLAQARRACPSENSQNSTKFFVGSLA